MGLRSPRSQQLQALAANAPGQQQEQLKQGQAAQTMQVQQAFGFGARQPGQTPTAGQIQQMGAQMTQAAGQLAVKTQEQGAQKAVARGQELLQIKQQQNQNALMVREQRLVQTERELQKKLYSISRQKGTELWSAQLKFEKDELGRTLFNERQLADWKVSQAKSYEDLAAYEQEVRQQSEKRMAMLKMAERKIQQAMENQWKLDETRRDEEFNLKLQKALHEIRLKQAREQAEAKNRAARSTALGSMIGGGFGLAAGVALTYLTAGAAAPLIPALITAGSSFGGAYGTMSATQQAKPSSTTPRTGIRSISTEQRSDLGNIAARNVGRGI